MTTHSDEPRAVLHETLEEALASVLGDAATLRRLGHTVEAGSMAALCRRISNAAEDYLSWITERQAVLRSAHQVPWVRARFAAWAREGNARMKGRQREYRRIVVPLGPQEILDAREAGRRAGREALVGSQEIVDAREAGRSAGRGLDA